MSDYNPDLTEDQMTRLEKSPVVRMAMACDDVASALEYVDENDDLRERLVAEVHERQTRVSSRETTDELFDALLAAMQSYAAMVRPVDADTEEDGDE